MLKASAPIVERIQTHRLLLRALNPSDAPALLEAITASLDHLRPWIRRAKDEPQSVEVKAEELRQLRVKFDLGRDFIYGIFDPSSAQVWGTIGSHDRIGAGARELGYWIRVDRINQGYATEAVAALIRVGFEIQCLRRMEIHCDPRNLPSAAVPRKLGFNNQVITADCVLSKTVGPRNNSLWALTRAAYASSPAASAPIAAFDSIDRKLL